MPPMTRPTEYPTGCPAPRQANAVFLYEPVGMLLVIRITDEGRHKDKATPCAARKRMSWMPVAQTPHAIVVKVRRKAPIR